MKTFIDRSATTGHFHRTGLALVAVLLLGLFIAGCSSAEDGEPGAAAVEEATEIPAEEAVETPVPKQESEAESAAEPSEASEAAAESDGDMPLSALDPAERNQYFDAPPEMVIDPETYYFATLVTEKGDIKLQLYADRAPNTVNNFVYLANQGFYDNTTFHRVLEGFMAQAGDPTGTGMGGPGYTFEDEIVPGLVFDKPGLLAMANTGQPVTNGSQFFITFGPTDWLNGLHTIFGEVIEGNEILGELTRRDPIQTDLPGDLIETILIEEGTESQIPTPTPLPPTPTPFPPSSMDATERPLADLDPEERVDYFNTVPEMIIDPEKQYVATIATSQGDIVFELRPDQAPLAVNNFVTLADLGFYDGLPVNAIMAEPALAIFGSPDGLRGSDAGYKFELEISEDIAPTKGSIAYYPFAESPNHDPQNSSSQLLITRTDLDPELANSVTLFGQATEGLDVLEQLTDEDMIDSIIIEVAE